MTLPAQLGRFFTGSVAGAVLDFGVATALVGLGVPLLVACTTGLACAVVLTYWVHLRWTFKVQETRFLSPYLIRFVGTSLLTLAVRVLIVEVGSIVFVQRTNWEEIFIIFVAIGSSFCVNFLLSTLWAFSQGKHSIPTGGCMKFHMRSVVNSRYIDIATFCIVVGVIIFMTIGQVTTGAHWIDDHHPGNILYGALSLLKGGTLFSEVQSIYGLTIPVIFAGSLHLFGEHYLSLFVLPVGFFIAGYIFFYFIFTHFMNRFLAMLSVLLMLAGHCFVILPWPNYIVFGLHAMVIYFFIVSIEKVNLIKKCCYMCLCGILVMLASSIRSQSLILYLILVIAVMLYCEKRSVANMLLALFFGGLLSILPFVTYLVINGTLYDYYAQTVLLSKYMYFNANSLWTVVTHGILSVFLVGYHSAPLTLPKLPFGLGVFGNLNGTYWGMLFVVSLFVSGALVFKSLRSCISTQQGNVARQRVLQSAAIFLIASLTAMGPLFSLHNIWDNFRYNIHMSQGLALLIFAAASFKNLQIASTVCLGFISFVILSYSAQVFPTFYNITASSFKQIQTVIKGVLPNSDLKYFEGVSVRKDFYQQMRSFDDFINKYASSFSGYYFYPDLDRITTSIYTIGKFIPYSKMLTNRHYHDVQNSVYPNFNNIYADAVKQRKLIFITTKTPSQIEYLDNYARVDICLKTGLCLLMPVEIVPTGIPISQIYSLSKQKVADFEDDSSFNLTDANWTKGVHKREAAFFVSNTPINQKKFYEGAKLKFANGEIRKITHTKCGTAYLNIYVSGAPLDGNIVGHPLKIDIIK